MNDPTLKRLSVLSRALNEASDRVSKQIAEVESALGALRLGVRAWVLVESSQESVESEDVRTKERKYTSLTHFLSLGYTRHKGKWALVVAEGYEEFSDDEDPNRITPLLEARRDVKLAAVEKIPALLKAIEEEGAKVAQEATKQAEHLKHIAAGLGKNAR